MEFQNQAQGCRQRKLAPASELGALQWPPHLLHMLLARRALEKGFFILFLVLASKKVNPLAEGTRICKLTYTGFSQVSIPVNTNPVRV